MPEDIRTNLEEVVSRIRRAAERSGREPESVKLVAVSKMQPSSMVSEAIAAGQRIFGENKVQEAEGKISEIASDVEWHLIGHLQSNKARRAVQLFDVIHSLDSIELAQRLERICEEDGRKGLSVFVQIDLAGERTKSGVTEAELPALVEFLRNCERLKLDGLMILPPFADDVESIRPYFKRLRSIRDSLASDGSFANGRGELSMGMSHDFEAAIEEGATVVRVGTAIFGDRTLK